MVETGLGSVKVQNCRIINVDMKHWTVDVRTQFSQQQLLDIQVGTPYLHFNSGEGIFAMPEVGAKAMVCTPSDGSAFIMCFCTTFEREGPPGDESETEQTTSTIPSVEGTGEDGEGTEVTFRAGRPYLQQGDLMMRCRDGNQIWLHRGGAIEIMSTGLCRRFYIPLNNVIRDVAENWQVDSLAGSMEWSVERTGSSAAEGVPREDNASFTLAAKNLVQDANYTVHMRAGHIDESSGFRLAIAPNALDEGGETEGDLSFLLNIDSGGSMSMMASSNANLTVQGEFTARIDGAASFEYGSDLSETIGGGRTVEITGDHSMSAASSTESLDSSKEISASSIKLGGPGAVTPVALASPALAAFLEFHTHTTPTGPSGPPVPPVPKALVESLKVTGE